MPPDQARRPLTVLLAGENPVGSAPILTLSAALNDLGVTTILSDGAEMRSTREWLRLVRASDALIIVGYDGPNWFFIRQLALSASFGRPVLRWWVGSDVLWCLDPALRGQARLLDRFCSANIAVAPHLVSELATIGIRAECVPSVLTPSMMGNADIPQGPVPKAVLVYLPDHRAEFFGGPIVKEAIERHPDLEFVIVADRSHSLAHFPNVRSLGWVDDIAPVLERCGALLRVTQHDGLPRMVLESLLRARYVIYNWDLPGCWKADDSQSVHEALEKFTMTEYWNVEGRDAVMRSIQPNPAKRFKDIAAAMTRGFRFNPRRLIALGVALRLTLGARRGA